MKLKPSDILAAEMAADQSVLLVGPPGCGKTGRILTAARAAKRRVVTVRASMAERVDLGGTLVPDIGAGVTRQLPLEWLRTLKDSQDHWLLFLDDLGQAPTDVQASCMRLFDNGELGPNVLIWAATNRPADGAGVLSLCEPLRSRFHAAYAIPTPDCGEQSPNGATLLGTWDAELEGWLDWAADHGAPAQVLAWHQSTSGKRLYQWKRNADPSLRMPDYRSWGAVIDRWNKSLRTQVHMAAVLGWSEAAQFLAYAGMNDIPTPDDIWADAKGAAIPKSPSGQWLVLTMAAQELTPVLAKPFVTYLRRFDPPMAGFAGRLAFRRIGSKLSSQPEWCTFWSENRHLFE